MTELLGLILSPVNPFRPVETQAVPGSKIMKASCGHTCWIAPEGQKLLADTPDVTTRCLVCSRDLMEDEDVDKYALPGSREAFREHHGVAAEDQAWAFMRDRYNVQEQPGGLT